MPFEDRFLMLFQSPFYLQTALNNQDNQHRLLANHTSDIAGRLAK